uniref:Uncharacterized protein n=1 Tax=Clytia hemisphaerica TaxID=252671 RepID=A0A7M5WVI1_9CNID|eukprot:TCONS_00019075-protein
MEIQNRLFIALVLLTSYIIQGYVLSERKSSSNQDDMKSLLKDIEELKDSEMLKEVVSDGQSSNQINMDLQRRLWAQSKAYRQVTEWFMKRYENQGISYRPFPSCKESQIPEKICKVIFDGYGLRHTCRTVYPITCM